MPEVEAFGVGCEVMRVGRDWWRWELEFEEAAAEVEGEGATKVDVGEGYLLRSSAGALEL